MAKRGKQSRRVSRRNRRAPRSRRNRRMNGGWLVLNPATVDDVSMASSSGQSAAQGKEFQQIHAAQHGGGAPLLGAPLDTTGVLDSSLRAAARVTPLDQATAAIQGMSDQSGGGRRRGRRRGSRKGRKGSRKVRKGRRSTRRNRRMLGGAALNPADASAPGTLLPPELEAKAVATMNPEWKLAEDPTSFAPKA